MPGTLYATLGVSPDATMKEIARAYRQLALQLHPDRNPNGAEAFKRVSAAYVVLSDPTRRGLYDATGAVPDGAGNAAEDAGAAVERRSAEIAQELAAFYATYRGSREEREDAARAFKAARGGFGAMIREHLLFDNGMEGEVERLHALVAALIEEGKLEGTARWAKTTTPAALRRIAAELAEERAAAEAELKKRSSDSSAPPVAPTLAAAAAVRGGAGGAGGALVINREQRMHQWDAMTDALMAKYAKPAAAKGGPTKKKKRHERVSE